MPALFFSALHPAIRAIRDCLPPGAEIVAHLDDVHVVCDPGEVGHALQTTEHMLRTICRIDINMGKLAI
eukprot:9248792-Pyramimonas_sp.AAC.1